MSTHTCGRIRRPAERTNASAPCGEFCYDAPSACPCDQAPAFRCSPSSCFLAAAAPDPMPCHGMRFFSFLFRWSVVHPIRPGQDLAPCCCCPLAGPSRPLPSSSGAHSLTIQTRRSLEHPCCLTVCLGSYCFIVSCHVRVPPPAAASSCGAAGLPPSPFLGGFGAR